MNKTNKIISGIIVGTMSSLLIIAGFLSRTNNPVSAQDNALSSSFPSCNQPIPTGEAYEEIISILQDSYAELQNLGYYLSSANEQLSSAISALTKNGEGVCDFSRCRTKIVDTAPDFNLEIWPLGVFGLHIPSCQTKECVGEPCPDMERYLGEGGIEGFKNAIKGSYEVVRAIFNTATKMVTNDIKKSGESGGELITRPEFAARKLRLARAWLHNAGGMRKSCSLSELEKAKVAAGKMNNVFPMRCKDALEQGAYWPKPTSEECENVCDNGLTDECQKCLSSQYKESSSPLAQINYKIYGPCFDSCKDGLSQECSDCICCEEFQGGKCLKTLSEEQCAAFICGGSRYNYVCCTEEQIPFEGFGGGASGGAGVSGEY